MLALGAVSARADELPKPTGEVILTLSGAISVRNAGTTAEFDLAMLEAMPKAVIKTSTPWTEGVATFDGVALGDLLKAVGASGARITASALNDYSATLPTGDADTGAIVAYRVDGRHLSVREKGPLWIIYPLDGKPELKSETIYARCVWQLRSLAIGG
jgi:hypothetical protein